MEQNNTLTDVQEQVVVASVQSQPEEKSSEVELDNLNKPDDVGIDTGIADVKSVQSSLQNKAAKAARMQAQQQAQLQIEKIRSENEILKSQILQSQSEMDLTGIKKYYSDEKANNVEEFGEDYLKLRANGIDALLAYRVVMESKNALIKPTPPEIGAVNESSIKEKDFYTSEEVDRLSDKDLSNPKIMKKVQYSMTKWQ